jgi:hypothetical protein
MNPVTVALVAENAVILAVVAAGWSLLRQGGGLQAKTPPVPKKAAGNTPGAADKTVPDITAARRPA